jgi:hypothetical protein
MTDFDYERLAAPIIEALKREKKGMVPLAIGVGETFLTARAEVDAKGFTDAKGKVHSAWPEVFPKLCELAGIKRRSGYVYIALAEKRELVQSSASIAAALRLIDDNRKTGEKKLTIEPKAKGDKRTKAPAPPSAPPVTTVPKDEPKAAAGSTANGSAPPSEPMLMQHVKSRDTEKIAAYLWHVLGGREKVQRLVGDFRELLEKDRPTIPPASTIPEPAVRRI